MDEDPQGQFALGNPKTGNPKIRERQRKYKAWCDAVRMEAENHQIKVPMTANKAVKVLFAVRSYFRNGVHPDPENVTKGIVDALFYRPKVKWPKGVKRPKNLPKGGKDDKYVGMRTDPPLYDKDRPRVEITIWWVQGEYVWPDVEPVLLNA